MQPVLKDHVTLLDASSNAAKLFCSHRRKVFTYEIDEAGKRAIESANGKLDLAGILTSVGVPRLSIEEVNAFFEKLIEDGLFHDAALDSKIEFEPNYKTRLERQLIYLSGLAPQGQRGHDLQAKLRESRVLIIGAGGGGSHLAVQLAGIGIGRLILVDHDLVELGNLGRQIFYANYIGKLKVEALKEIVRSISPETQVATRPERLMRSAPWLGEYLPKVDLVLNCADQPSMDETTRWLFEACYPLKLPLIPGGGYNGHFTSLPPTLLPGRSTCWPCYEHDAARKRAVRIETLNLSQIKSGIFLPATIAMAALQMPEIVRVLTGYEPPRFLNCRGEFDLNTCSLELETVAPTPGCGTCEGTA
ncbi:MAG: ThiF family adenylyltransferase [Elusimicrobia bacterium]|nr:ThiF family adenylyltransferase [Elusimicrobiota bacterium]